jgi:predicted amidophosphoribosyltransferase
MSLHPQGIAGPWKSGIVLDWHTVDSQRVGDNAFGYPVFETRRSDIGELLFRLKYRGDLTALNPLVECAAHYLGKARNRFDLLVPVPPSNANRKLRPTVELARGLGRQLSLPVAPTGLVKIRPTPQIKTIRNLQQRDHLLKNAFAADPRQMAGSSVLLIDDLYRSGATLAAATRVAYDQGRARDVYVFAITRTRVNQ